MWPPEAPPALAWHTQFMAPRRSLRSQVYRAARDLGNVEAAAQGPSAYGRRVVRRRIYRTTNRWTRRFLRGFGL